MSNQLDREVLVFRLLAGELSDEEATQALDAIEQEPELRELLLQRDALQEAAKHLVQALTISETEIRDYILGNMTQDQQRTFEERVSKDEDAQDRVEQAKKLLKTLQTTPSTNAPAKNETAHWVAAKSEKVLSDLALHSEAPEENDLNMTQDFRPAPSKVQTNQNDDGEPKPAKDQLTASYEGALDPDAVPTVDLSDHPGLTQAIGSAGEGLQLETTVESPPPPEVQEAAKAGSLTHTFDQPPPPPPAEPKRMDQTVEVRASQQPPPPQENSRYTAVLEFHSKSNRERHTLQSGPTLIGALHPCQIQIEDSEVSGVHARLLFRESTGGLWIEDLRSTNGTYLLQDVRKIRLSAPSRVEGKDYLLTYPQELKNGDKLLVGDTYITVEIHTK